jgi:hypothetical protein
LVQVAAGPTGEQNEGRAEAFAAEAHSVADQLIDDRVLAAELTLQEVFDLDEFVLDGSVDGRQDIGCNIVFIREATHRFPSLSGDEVR